MLTDKLVRIKLLLMDVDGVLTDGRIIYDDMGYETKEFSVKDGLGIRLLIESGISVGIITGRCSNALSLRCDDLGIDYLKDSVENKAEALRDLLLKVNVLAMDTAFIGDDLPDLSVMAQVGLSVAVADAADPVLEAANLVTSAKGGEGAVREFAELILKSKGEWGKIIKRFSV